MAFGIKSTADILAELIDQAESGPRITRAEARSSDFIKPLEGDLLFALGQALRSNPITDIPFGSAGNLMEKVGTSGTADIKDVALAALDVPIGAPAKLAGTMASALIGMTKGVKRVPTKLYHGVGVPAALRGKMSAKEAVQDTLNKGFRYGESAEIKIPGTSTSADPTVALRGFANDDLSRVLVAELDIDPKDVVNLRPSEYLSGVFPEAGVYQKPNVFFQEKETFLLRPSAPKVAEIDKELGKIRKMVLNEDDAVKREELLIKDMKLQIERDLVDPLHVPNVRLRRLTFNEAATIQSQDNQVRKAMREVSRLEYATIDELPDVTVKIADSLNKIRGNKGSFMQLFHEFAHNIENIYQFPMTKGFEMLSRSAGFSDLTYGENLLRQSVSKYGKVKGVVHNRLLKATADLSRMRKDIGNLKTSVEANRDAAKAGDIDAIARQQRLDRLVSDYMRRLDQTMRDWDSFSKSPKGSLAGFSARRKNAILFPKGNDFQPPPMFKIADDVVAQHKK